MLLCTTLYCRISPNDNCVGSYYGFAMEGTTCGYGKVSDKYT